MNPIVSIDRRVEPSPLIHDHDRALACRLAARPSRNSVIERNNAPWAVRATTRIQRQNLCDDDLHCGIACAHLINECAEGGDDSRRRNAAMPYVVRTEMH